MKKIKILTITLAIILITMISFGGIYTQYQNRMENKVKDYSYAMDLKGTRNIRLKVSTKTNKIVKDSEGKIVENSENLTDDEITQNGYTTEETPINSEEVKTVENYNKSKEIIEKRLKDMYSSSYRNAGIEYNYIVKLDEQTGDIIIQLPDNNKTDDIISTLSMSGRFEILDKDTQEVLLSNSDIKTQTVRYGNSGTTSAGTTVYLDVQFDKEGTQKLEDITKTYVESDETENTTEDNNTTENQTTEENSEETTSDSTEDTKTEKKITLKMNDEEVMSTSFKTTVENGELPLSIGGVATDNETLEQNIEQASNLVAVIKNGVMPVVYELNDNELVLSDITENDIQNIGYVILILFAISLIVFIIRYKLLGVLGAVSNVGLFSLLLIVIRYWNVEISIEGILGIVTVLALNYMFVNKLLLKLKNRVLELEDVKKAYKQINKEFFIKIIPVIIVAVVFTLCRWTPLNSFGMIMFWGIVLIAIYNVIVTRSLLKNRAVKSNS